MSDQQGSPKVFVVCMKWGTAYGARHVNNLYRGAKKWLSYDHEFVLIGDNRDGIEPEVKFIELDPLGIPPSKYQRGIYPKLVLYKEGLFPAGSIVLFIDLDTLIMGDLDRFVDRVREMRGTHIVQRRQSRFKPILPKFLHRDRGGDTTMVGFIADEDHALYDRFMADPDTHFNAIENDQDYVTKFAQNRHYWPVEWCVLFKRTLLWSFPLNLLLRKAIYPDNCVVNFGGFPKIEEMLKPGELRFGKGRKYKIVKTPVPWVVENWPE